MKILTCITFSCVFISGCREEDTIPRLKWEYFQGKKPADSTGLVYTAYYLLPVFNSNYTFVRPFQLTCTFSRRASWKDSSIFASLTPEKKERLLNHEEGHFKIGIIFAKSIQREIIDSAYDSRRPLEFNRILAIYANGARQMTEENVLYDNETAHGRNLVNQADWDSLISAKLIKLENIRIKIRIDD